MRIRFFSRHALLCALLLWPSATLWAQPAEPARDWRRDWQLQEGFSLERAGAGFEFPVAIAFVREASQAPDAPFFFVLELRGRLKVVTRDGSVHTYAEGLTAFRPTDELPSTNGEAGSTGICLDEARGRIYIGGVQVDAQGRMRNSLTRLEGQGGQLGLQASERRELGQVFEGHPASLAHHASACVVDGEHVYLGVGDAMRPELARDLSSPCGKVLRMTLDGEAVADNPHFRVDAPKAVASFIYASGLRNPFGLKRFDGQLYLSDNGNRVDRFAAVDAGDDLLYDGSDWSTGSRADMVLWPSVSPVTFDRDLEGIFPEQFRSSIFMNLSGSPMDAPGPGVRGQKSMVHFRYDFERRRVRQTPTPFLRWVGPTKQVLVALSFGPDGLYFAPLLPDASGETPIYRIRHAPEQAHPYPVDLNAGPAEDARALLARKGCLGCHRLDGSAGGIGPSLEPQHLGTQVEQRFAQGLIQKRFAELDAQKQPGAERRRAVLEVEGPERVARYVAHQIAEPRYSNPISQMPQIELSEAQIRVLTNALLGPYLTKAAADAQAPPAWLARLTLSDTQRTVGAFVAGALAGGLLMRRRRASG